MLCTYCKLVHFTNCIVHFVNFWPSCTKYKIKVLVQFAKKKNEIVHFMKIIYFKIVRIIKQYNYSLQVLINVLFISQTRLNN